MDYRIEEDSMGKVKVPADKYWGAQSQRSYENFPIGKEKMPLEVIYSLSAIKYAAARANEDLGVLDKDRSKLIQQVAEEIIQGKLDGNFPLSLWQTGSGTQTNMNVNEVITHRGNELYGEKILHPNDHVNMSQSSNDTFPTAMHIAGIKLLKNDLILSLDYMVGVLEALEEKNKGIYKTARTHFQDAVPISFSQEISAWTSQIKKNRAFIKESLSYLSYLPIGGTAVGTGINAPEGFDETIVGHLSDYLGHDFKPSKNKFSDISVKTSINYSHGSLKTLASDLLKIANDIRMLASGPRTGLGEIKIPSNEPGSSIMPGKVNPTQAEALAMVCVQVIANDLAISIGSSQGNFQLNTYMPLIIYNYLQSLRILSDSIKSFTKRCLEGLTANKDKMEENIDKSLMLATALNTSIGYDKAARAVNYAEENDLTLKEACIKLDILSEDEYNEIMDLKKLTGN